MQNPAQAQDAARQVRALNETIRSATAQIKDQTVQLDLPVADRAMCGKVNYPDELRELMKGGQ
jgi:hypothetical protein